MFVLNLGTVGALLLAAINFSFAFPAFPIPATYHSKPRKSPNIFIQ
jgi:hypothetical protein